MTAACPCLFAIILAVASPAADLELFNGRNLDGWTSWLVDTGHEDPRQVYTVTNGLLRISGNGLGYLAKGSVFTNYHLLVEYRWGATNWPWGNRIGKARDSGLFLHATGPHGNSDDGHGAFMAALECNLFQGATGDFLLIRGRDASGRLIAPRLTIRAAPGRDSDGWPTWDPAGKPLSLERWGRVNWREKDPAWQDLLDFRGSRDRESLSPAWTTVECLSRNGTLQIRVNGTLVNEATDVWPRHGRILLQCEGSEIFFRRVALLAAPVAVESALPGKPSPSP